MNAPAKIAAPTKALDDIRCFLPDIGDDEYAVRARIRSCKNVAAYKAVNTQSPVARQLCWLCVDAGIAWIYAPGSLEILTEAAEFCRRLVIVAEQAEKLEGVA